MTPKHEQTKIDRAKNNDQSFTRYHKYARVGVKLPYHAALLTPGHVNRKKAGTYVRTVFSVHSLFLRLGAI